MSNKIDGAKNAIVDKLSSIDSKLENIVGGNVDTSSIDNFDYSYFDQVTQLVNNVKNDIAVIDTQFNELKNIFQNGFNPSSVNISHGCNPIFSVNLFGQNIEINLCSAFSAFKPFFTFIITLIFFYLSVRILYIGIKYDR